MKWTLEVFLPPVGGFRRMEPDEIKGGPQFCGRRNETDTVDGVGYGERGKKGRHLRPVSVKILETVGPRSCDSYRSPSHALASRPLLITSTSVTIH